MYSTIQEVLDSGLTKTELIHLLNDEERLEEDIDLNNPADVLVVRANAKIKKAATYIDGYLRGRFTLPLTSTPDLIKDLSNDYSIYFIYEHRHKTDMPEDLQIKKKGNDKVLMGIQKGDISPGIPDALPKADTIIKTNKSDNPKIFTDEYLNDF